MVFPKAPEIWHGITELFHVVSDYCFTAVKKIFQGIAIGSFSRLLIGYLLVKVMIESCRGAQASGNLLIY